MGKMLVKIFFIAILLIISYIDYKRRIIPDILLVFIFILIFFKNVNIGNIYLSMSIHSFPLFIIWLIEEHIEKELIGLGDIKFMMVIGAYRSNTSLSTLYSYYFLIYLVSFFSIIFFKKEKYIPFAPMISFVTIFFEFFDFNLWSYL